MTFAPAPAMERKTWLVFADVEQSALVRRRHDRLDRMLEFIDRYCGDEISGRRNAGKILFVETGRHEGIDITLFELHRYAVLGMHHHQMEQPCRKLHLELFGQRRRRL